MRKTGKTLLLLISLAGTVSTIQPSIAATASDVEELPKRIQAIAALSNQEYIADRKLLEVEAAKDNSGFQKLEMTSPDWQVRLVCGIVLERVQKKAEIKEFLDWQPKYPLDNSMTERYHRLRVVSKALAEHGKTVPFLLVEKLWKDNEVNKWEGAFWTDARAYLADALGLLKVRAARQPLEEIILAPLPDGARYDREAAARALAALADPASVPALVKQLEQGPGDRDQVPADYALSKCADASSLPYLEEKAATTQQTLLKELLEAAVAKIKAGK